MVLIIIGVLMDSSSRGKAAPRAAAPKSSGSRLPAILLGILVLAIAGGVAAYLILGEMEKREVRQKYGDAIVDLCEGPGGVASPSNLPTAAPPWKVVVLTSDGKRDSWHNALPAERRAEDQASTVIVACLEEHEQVIEECQYSTRSINRIQHYVDVTLFNAASGLPITTFQVWGSVPGACPGVITRRTGDVEGDNPSGLASSGYFDDFYAELTKTVQ